MAVKAVPFHSKEYWQSRFDNEHHFEWLSSWSSLEQHIKPYLDSEPILHLGCGNSTLAFDMADHGYNYIVNVDYADNVIEHMKSMTDSEKYPNVLWYTADCLKPLSPQIDHTSFAVVIDKSLSDTIACGDTDDLTEQRKLAQNILEITRPQGVWLSISFSSERQHCALEGKWKWHRERAIPIKADQSHDKPGAPEIYHYLYVMRKVPCE
ncbi:S-adenosyl-L-methionine-dependent methyltransferase [Fennellomyces sp. T-0311]|nr:S-adenosyl-L-methionine-dependent methyltransferase [Fennellomyces sp. T-0311]